MSREYTAYVDADHVSPDFTFRNHPVTVTQSEYDGHWSAFAAKLGCSRCSYLSAEEAIEALFEAHCCTAIRIKTVGDDR